MFSPTIIAHKTASTAPLPYPLYKVRLEYHVVYRIYYAPAQQGQRTSRGRCHQKRAPYSPRHILVPIEEDAKVSEYVEPPRTSSKVSSSPEPTPIPPSHNWGEYFLTPNGLDPAFCDDHMDEAITKMMEEEAAAAVDKADEDKENVAGPSFRDRHM